MPLLNIAVVSASRGHIPWTVIQIEPGLTFVQLFEKIVASAHPILSLDVVLTGLQLEKVLVGQAREVLSVVDENLMIDDVCPVFGQHVKYLVLDGPNPDASACSTSCSSNLRNASTVLMKSQKAIDSKTLPSKHQEQNKER